MIEILADGQPLYFAPSEQLAITSPKLTLERGKAGSFQFILPPVNKYYDKLKKLKTVITVGFDGTQVFRGRVLSTEKDFYNCCSVYCEGDLAYLNDSVQKGEKYTGTTHALFRKIIEAHNAQVDAEKRFEIGDITIEDRDIVLKGKTDETSSDEVDYRQIEIDAIADEWKTTFDYIETCLIDYCGGYLQTRCEGDVTYLDLLSETTDDAASQRIEFGVNMLDLTEAITAEELFTVLIPLGDENLTIESVNNGSSELVDETLVAEYGRIVKTHVFDSVNQPEALLENGQRFLEGHANVPVTLTIRAVDMHLTDKDTQLSDDTSASIELLTTTTGEHADSIASLTTKTDAQGAAIELKAAQDDLDAAVIRLSSAEAAIKLKASQTTVDEQGERISTAEADINAANAAILLKASKDDLDAVSLSMNAANRTITLKADKTYVDNLYAACVKASVMETEVLKVFEKARISDLKATNFGCSDTASIGQLNATGAIIQNLAITSLQISASGVEKRALKMGELVSANVWGTATTDVDLGHSHKVTVNDDGTITLGEVATTGGSFRVADTAYYKNGVSAARTAGKNDYISNLAIWGLSGTDFTVCAGNGTKRYADMSQTGELSLIVASKLVKASVNGVQVGTISCQDVYDAGYDAGYQAAINDAAVSVAQGSGAVTIVFGETTKEAGSIWA